MGKALRALSCSFWGGHQTYAHYFGHSAIKAVLCDCQNNCNRCQKITALVKSTPKAPAQGLIQAPEANEHLSPDVNCFQTVFLTHFQCNVGGEGGTNKFDCQKGILRFHHCNYGQMPTPCTAAQTHSQGSWYFICTTISYLHSQGTVKTEFQVPFSPARYKDNSMPGAATRPKGAKLARILPLSIQHLTPWQTPQQLCLAALGSVMWLGCW